jgi:hypothetical protein
VSRFNATAVEDQPAAALARRAQMVKAAEHVPQLQPAPIRAAIAVEAGAEAVKREALNVVALRDAGASPARVRVAAANGGAPQDAGASPPQVRHATVQAAALRAVAAKVAVVKDVGARLKPPVGVRPEQGAIALVPAALAPVAAALAIPATPAAPHAALRAKPEALAGEPAAPEQPEQVGAFREPTRKEPVRPELAKNRQAAFRVPRPAALAAAPHKRW